jgi:hypothetical protein
MKDIEGGAIANKAKLRKQVRRKLIVKSIRE